MVVHMADMSFFSFSVFFFFFCLIEKMDEIQLVFTCSLTTIFIYVFAPGLYEPYHPLR